MCRNCPPKYKQKPRVLPVPIRNKSVCLDCQDCAEIDSRFRDSNKWFSGRPCNVCGHGKSSHFKRPPRVSPYWEFPPRVSPYWEFPPPWRGRIS